MRNEGVDGLLDDKTRAPGTAPLTSSVKLAVLSKTATETPTNATHWSVRSMAKAMGIGHSSVQRIWSEAGLKPHLLRTFKISSDPQFEEKVTDVVGLYMNPPDKALVICVDEKIQIQALDRSQPGLPMKKGRAATMTHDYKRHGTTTLFAALDVKIGFVIGECLPRHRTKDRADTLRTKSARSLLISRGRGAMPLWRSCPGAPQPPVTGPSSARRLMLRAI